MEKLSSIGKHQGWGLDFGELLEWQVLLCLGGLSKYSSRCEQDTEAFDFFISDVRSQLESEISMPALTLVSLIRSASLFG